MLDIILLLSVYVLAKYFVHKLHIIIYVCLYRQFRYCVCLYTDIANNYATTANNYGKIETKINQSNSISNRNYMVRMEWTIPVVTDNHHRKRIQRHCCKISGLSKVPREQVTKQTSF